MNRRFPVSFDNTLQAAVNAAMGDVVEGDELEKYAIDIGSMVPYWDKVDAIIEGEEAIRLAGKDYLPKFTNEKNEAYENRLALTKFTNVFRDIVEGLSTKPFEEETQLVGENLPEEIVKFVENVDGAGNNLTQFASQTFFNGIASAIEWINVDFPIVDKTKIVTVADAKAAGVRPFWTHVLGRNVREARVTMVNGIEQLSYIRIFEPGAINHVRICEMINGVANWLLYEKLEKPSASGKTQYRLKDRGTYSINIIPYVPFWTGRRDGRTYKFFPAMRDAADLQIQLYQQESGLKFIKTMAAYPMLAANGIKQPMEADGKTPKTLAVGPAVVLWSGVNADGKAGSWGYVEPAATSMDFLAKDILATKQDLRELGRQPLTAQSGNLTVITTAVAAGKAKSTVGQWALALKDCLENCMKLTALWYQFKDVEPEINVFNEFDDVLDDGKDLSALLEARKNRDISRVALLNELKRRKTLAPEFDAEADALELLKEVPSDDQDLDDENPEPQPGNVA